MSCGAHSPKQPKSRLRGIGHGESSCSDPFVSYTVGKLAKNERPKTRLVFPKSRIPARYAPKKVRGQPIPNVMLWEPKKKVGPLHARLPVGCGARLGTAWGTVGLAAWAAQAGGHGSATRAHAPRPSRRSEGVVQHLYAKGRSSPVLPSCSFHCLNRRG